MSGDVILALVMRWVHIGCAMVAIGGPFFVRFGLMPTAGKVLDEESHRKLREAINARWRVVVYCVITLFLVSGLYQFFVETRVNGVLITARWKEFGEPDRKLYQMWFGIKMMGAFGIFFLASALAGRSATFLPIRKKAKMFVGILLLLGVVVLGCAVVMRYLPWTVSTVPIEDVRK